MDIFSSIFATLKASTYYDTTLSGFEDSEGRFKVWEEGLAPSSAETPYVTVEILPAPKAQATGWNVPTVMLHFWGNDTEIETLNTMRDETEDIFRASKCFAAVDGADPIEYRVMGDIVYGKPDFDPVLEQVVRSLGINFGIEST